MLGGTSYFGTQIAGTALSPPTRQVFEWVKSNTPADSRFLVLTGNTENTSFCNGTQEWFPALTGRISLTTVQGTEWLEGPAFDETASDARAAENCVSSADPLLCIERLASSRGGRLEFDYLYVARSTPILTNCRVMSIEMRGERLIAELKRPPDTLRFTRLMSLPSSNGTWVRSRLSPLVFRLGTPENPFAGSPKSVFQFHARAISQS